MPYNASTRTFDTIADLRAQKGIANSSVSVLGYSTVGDYGGTQYYWDQDCVDADDGGCVIRLNVGDPAAAGGWRLKYGPFINAESFGVIGDGVTDITSNLQRAMDACVTLKATLYIPKAKGNYIVSFTNSQSVFIKGSINIESNGATIYADSANSTSTIFNLYPGLPADTEISFSGLNCNGNRRFNFIRTAPTTPVPAFLIKSFTIQGCTFGTQSIIADWDCTDRVVIENQLSGYGVDENSLYGCQISVVQRADSPECKTLIVRDCKVMGNEAQIDMFFIKGGASRYTEMTNLIAQRFVQASGTGDGFDLDGMGFAAKLSNLYAINCGIEIKGDLDYFDGAHLTANNLVSINSSGAGISIRTSGVYNNIYCYNSNGRALNVTGFNPTNATQDEQDIVISNVACVYAGAAAYTPVALGLSNVNIKGLHIYNDPGFSSFGAAQPIRLAGTFKNLIIDGFHIRGGANGIYSDPDGNYTNVTIKNGVMENITSRLFSLSGTGITGLTIDNVNFVNYTGGTNYIIFSAPLEQIKISNMPAAALASMATKSGFQTYSSKVVINGMYAYDYSGTAGNPPVISDNWPVGCTVQNMSDATTWMKVSTSGVQTTAYTQVNAFNNLNTVGAKNLFLATSSSSGSNTKASLRGIVKSDVAQVFGSEGTDPTGDWNLVANTYPGFGPNLIFGGSTNGPGTGNFYYYPLTLNFGSTKDGTGNVTQIAIPYNNNTIGLWFRYRISGTWSAWTNIWDANTLYGYRTETIDYTLLSTDGVLFMNNTVARTVTLPLAASALKKAYFIKKVSNNTSIVTITRSGSDTIDGDVSIFLPTFGDCVGLESDGTTWRVITTTIGGKFAIRTVTATATMNSYDWGLLVNNTAAAVITLPTASTVTGKTYWIKKSSNNAFAVTITGAEQGVDVALSSFNDSVFIQSNGTSYFVISRSIAVGTPTLNQVLTAGGTSALSMSVGSFTSTGSFSLNQSTITASTTLTDAQTTVWANNAAAIVVSLPTSAGRAGRIYIIKKVSANAFAVTIDPAGTETIDGLTTVDLTTQYDFIVIQSDGTNWFQISPAL
jgi:hypothetical protein